MNMHSQRSPRFRTPANPEEISTGEFFRQLFADSPEAIRTAAPVSPAEPAPNPAQFQEMSTEEFFRELFATPETPLTLGPRQGLEPPALPAKFRRVRGGNQVVSYELLVDGHGRIAAKHENVAGRESYFIYEYDQSGHLLRTWRDGSLAEEYAYDPRGARVASWNARDGQWKYGYDERGRLAAAGPWTFGYAEDGSLREAWTGKVSFRLAHDQAGGLCRIVLPGGRVLRSETIAPGLPTEKYVNAAPVESLTWRSPLQLAFYRDHRRGVRMQFHYTGTERLPQAVTVHDAQGDATYLLGYDQVGSLKAVAAMGGEHEGRVVKVVDYDAFGNVLADSNPGLFMPLAFAGGLRDRFTGLVRFCHRDYDPTVGRFTAPDPLGDTGGDHDLYDYCVDEPVGRVDPEGLEGESALASSGFFSGVGDWFDNLGKKIGGLFSPDAAQVATGNETVQAGQPAATNATGEGPQARKGVLDSVAPEWNGIGVAADAGAGIGVGPSRSDPKAIADGYGNGMYAEYVPGSGNSTGKVDGGLFRYDTHGRIAGIKAGAGYNVTVYDPPASKTLEGSTGYQTWHLGPFSTTRLHDLETGRIVGWSLGLGGKGVGIGKEVGESTGEIAKRAK